MPGCLSITFLCDSFRSQIGKEYDMQNVHDRDDEVIELGVASEETKGQGRIDQDSGGTLLKFVSGIAED